MIRWPCGSAKFVSGATHIARCAGPIRALRRCSITKSSAGSNCPSRRWWGTEILRCRVPPHLCGEGATPACLVPQLNSVDKSLRHGPRYQRLPTCFCGETLVSQPTSVASCSWERHAPAWLPEPGWSPALPGDGSHNNSSVEALGTLVTGNLLTQLFGHLGVEFLENRQMLLGFADFA